MADAGQVAYSLNTCEDTQPLPPFPAWYMRGYYDKTILCMHVPMIGKPLSPFSTNSFPIVCRHDAFTIATQGHT